MSLINWIEDDATEGEAAGIYRQWREANPGRTRVPDILKCFSLRPDFLRQVREFSGTVHFADGHLNRRTKEMIATLVSGLNQCPY
jgi:alkylhydroperoxidase family enzyme